MNVESAKLGLRHEDAVVRVVSGLLRAGRPFEAKASCEAAFTIGATSPVLVLAYALAAIEVGESEVAEATLAWFDAHAVDLPDSVLASRNEVARRLPGGDRDPAQRAQLVRQASAFLPKLPRDKS